MMFSTHIFLYYFSVKQIITRLELDSSPLPLVPFPKPAFPPLFQTICSAPWPGTWLTLTSSRVPRSCLFDSGLILISPCKLASTPVLLEELETWIAFSLFSFWLRLHSQQQLWTWTLPLPLLNSLVPCHFLPAPLEWPSTALQLLVLPPPMAVRRHLENASLVMALTAGSPSVAPVTYNLRGTHNCGSGSLAPSLRGHWKTAGPADCRREPH